ncbi:MarR family winged helix-turn-helix transcriptional regulator [Micromonospora globbae]|uniref:MarR family transcriptional regulator n=1 Tax=Micromonospora globbae TaxID=1894969 RepID=A0A420ESK6_9ACTN|nr:MarR family winged helix-turn-helix transcriptional regulator [Micromonospora globbae]RKF23640.1 MarR family transcriptional regulator [Micromonospora globbae]
MTHAPEPVPAHAMFKVLAALAELGEATAAAVADKAGLGYSTATAKLRALEHTGQAEPIRTEDKRAVWRLTDAGRTTVGADHSFPPAHDTGTDAPPEAPAQTTPDDDPAEERNTTEDADTADEEPPTPQPDDPTGTAPSAASRATADAPSQAHGGAAEPAVASDADSEHPSAASESDPAAPAAEAGTSTAGSRRTKGSLRGAVLDILEAHPDRAYKTSELCKLIDAANAGTDAKKASAGAVVNAADKLVNDGKAVRTVDKPATFQLAPANP